jgi:methylated-DNA-protein-cysteine methyltransferase related protein
MPPSLAFARIRAEVFAAACAVPAGRVTTYGAIARHLEVVPRHVAFVLSGLNEGQAEEIPWHRVVGEGGKVRLPTSEGLDRQRRRLKKEGVVVSTAGVVRDFDTIVFRWPERVDGPGRTVRRPYADESTRPLFPEAFRHGYPAEAAALKKRK